jgi:hypothetical protein
LAVEISNSRHHETPRGATGRSGIKLDGSTTNDISPQSPQPAVKQTALTMESTSKNPKVNLSAFDTQ